MNIDPFLYSSFPANFIFPFLFNFYFIPIFLFNPLQFLRTQCRNSACFSNFFDRFIFGWGKGRWSESWTPIVTPLGFLPRLKKFPRRKRFTSNEWTRSHFHFFYLLLPSDTVTRRALIMRGVKRLSCDTSTLTYPARKPRSETKDEDPRLRSIFRILFIYLILYFFFLFIQVSSCADCWKIPSNLKVEDPRLWFIFRFFFTYFFPFHPSVIILEWLENTFEFFLEEEKYFYKIKLH